MTNLYRLMFRFFTINAEIQSDSDVFLSLFSSLYPGCLGESTGDCRRHLSFKLFTEGDNIFGLPAMVIGDEVYPLETPLTDLTGFHYFIMRKIRESLEAHFLIHGGAVSRDGAGVLLIGDPYFGKTTLTLEMVRHGFDYLSEEMASISRFDGLVHPYPRCLSIRPSTYDNLGLTFHSEVNPAFGNHMLDIDDLYPGRKGCAVPISKIFILSDPAMMPETVGTSATRLLHIWLENPTPGYLAALRALPGTADVVAQEKADHTRVTLTAGDPLMVKEQVRRLSQGHGVDLLGISSRVVHKPVFTSPPALQPIPPSQAARFLFQRFLGGRDALLGSTPGGSSTRLFLELMDLISAADCYTLNVGPLDQMASLIDDITQ